ncbi:MAG: hypothetical protein DRP45_10475 [Candidatus Zixiibacteriota bacterium]|nr:MAG: hypothetical protein DRP45_10475 [candidate division Zixibacteria bacterium]
MNDNIRLKDKYTLAKCCQPTLDDPITGYFSHDDFLKVHRTDCRNLQKTDPARLVELDWKDIIADESPAPDDDYKNLDEIDFAILRHHREYGVDYSLMVARILHMDKQEVFEHHRKLREMKLLQRVDPLIIRYRKGIVDNKWIKHRNHTYYELTDKGGVYLDFHIKEDDTP